MPADSAVCTRGWSSSGGEKEAYLLPNCVSVFFISIISAKLLPHNTIVVRGSLLVGAMQVRLVCFGSGVLSSVAFFFLCAGTFFFCLMLFHFNGEHFKMKVR